MDTIEFIPKYIPIPEVSIDDHLKRGTYDIVHLSIEKNPSLLAIEKESVRVALLEIAKVLHHNKTDITLEIAEVKNSN